MKHFSDFVKERKGWQRENSEECLNVIFELLGKNYNEFIDMSNDKRVELVRDLKIKNVLGSKWEKK